MPFSKQLKDLHDAFHGSGIECKWNEPLSAHTSFQIGGKAALIVWPASRAQLIQVLSFWRELGGKCPLCLLGKGSNVLFTDRGYHGLVVVTTRAKRVVFQEDEVPDREQFRKTQIYCQVYAECGASLTALAFACGEDDRSLSGLEFAFGIPGTVGGATVMNAGAYGGDMEQVLVASEYFDLSNGRIVRLTDKEMDLAYRHSVYLEHPEWIVLSSVLSLSYGNAADIRAKMEANKQSRKEKQPLDYPSAGSVFKRPVDNFAGKMVDTVGLKGYSIGGAQVSEKHAGFIINKGNATAADVIALVRLVRAAVEEVYHYRLECEIRLISDGLDPEDIRDW